MPFATHFDEMFAMEAEIHINKNLFASEFGVSEQLTMLFNVKEGVRDWSSSGIMS